MCMYTHIHTNPYLKISILICPEVHFVHQGSQKQVNFYNSTLFTSLSVD